MSLKLFFLTTEITPFADTSILGNYSVHVPLTLQTMGHDIRTMIPKYGFVSERKYILREVIRLREIPFEFDGDEVIASAKSAFIPKTRVQVYFLENVDWFKPLTNLLYKAKNGRVLPDNIKGNKVNCYEAAAPFADLIIAIDTPSNDVTKKLMKLPGVKANKKKLVSILLNDDEFPDFIAPANALNEELTKLFV